MSRYLKDILLSNEQQKNIEERRKEKNKDLINLRKGKCLPGREVVFPKKWSNNLIHIVSHYMFDGRIDEDSCIYYNKSKYQIEHLAELLYRTFKVKPKIKMRDNGVYGLAFYHVEFAAYIKNCRDKLMCYINNGASKLKKRIFLQAFFDDEGCVFYNRDKRRVRGYQKDPLFLKVVKRLLADFDIKGRIDNSSSGIEISGRGNLFSFAKEINFSPQIYINPNRKNGIWKRKISKRAILERLLGSYK